MLDRIIQELVAEVIVQAGALYKASEAVSDTSTLFLYLTDKCRLHYWTCYGRFLTLQFVRLAK